MSKTVDERVVSMEFDNDRFEKNVSTSLSTLDKLKKALRLDGATKSLEEVDSSFNKFSAVVEASKAKWDALEVVAVGALLKIGSQAVATGERLVKSISVDQVSEGWRKFSDKTTSVATLVAQGNAIEYVNEQLAKLNWFTDETSYNFTDMVSNIAKFTATGKGLEESVQAMEGIASWAALSGQNPATASRAMYQLSQALSAGYMRREDWKSIQNVSMDTDEFRQKTIEAAVALGTLQDNLDGTYTSLINTDVSFTKTQFVEGLTDGAWFTSDVMMTVYRDYASAVDAIYKVTEETGSLASDVMGDIHKKAKEFTAQGLIEDEAIDKAIIALGYVDEAGNALFDHFGLKAFEAGQNARTFADAIDAVKDAVSTGWMNTFEKIFGNAEEATVVWTKLANSLYELFAEGGNVRNAMLDEALVSSSWSKLTDFIEEAGIEVSDFEKAVTKAADGHGIYIQRLIQEYGSLQEVFTSGEISARTASIVMKEALASLTKTTSTSVDNSVEKLAEIQKVFDDIWMGVYGNDYARKKALTVAGYDYEIMQKLINKFSYGSKINFDSLTEAELKTLGVTKNQVDAFVDLQKQAEETGVPLEDLINNITRPSGRTLLLQTVYNVLGSVKNIIISIQEAFREIFTNPEAVYNAISWWHELSKSFVVSDETLDRLTRTFKGLFAVIDLGLTLVKDIARVGVETLQKILEKIGIKKATANILELTASFGDWLVACRDQIKEHGVLQTIIDSLLYKLSDLGDWISKIAKKIYDLPIVNKTLKETVNWVKKIWKSVKQYLTPVIQTFSQLVEDIKNLGNASDHITLDNIIEVLLKFKENLKKSLHINEFIKIGKNVIFGFIEGVKGNIPKIISNMTKFASYIVDTVKDYLGIHSPSKVFMYIGLMCIAGLIAGLTTGYGPIKTSITGLIDWITDAFKKVDWDKVFVVAALGTFIYLVTQASKSIAYLASSFKVLARPLSTVAESISDFFWGLNKSIKQKMQSDYFITLATAILMLVGAVLVLAYVPWEKTQIGIAALGFILTVVTMFSLILNSFKFNVQAITGLSKFLLAMSALVFILGTVIKDLVEINSNDAGISAAFAGIFELIFMLGAVYAALWAVGKWSNINTAGADIFKGILVLGSIGVALLAFVRLIKKLSEFTPEQIRSAVLTVRDLSAIFGGLILVFKLVDNQRADMEKAGKMILSISSALIAIAFAIKILAGIEKGIGQAYVTIVTLLGLIIGFVAIFATLKDSRVNMEAAGNMLLKASTGIAVLALAVKVLAKCSTGDIFRALAFITAAEVLFAGLIWVSKLAGQYGNAAGNMLLKASFGILALTVAVKMLASCSGEDIVKALIFVGGVELLFGILIAASKKSGRYANEVGNMLMKMTIPLLALVACVAVLSFLKFEEVVQGTAAVMVIMGMFALIIAASEKVRKTNIVGPFLAIGGAIAILSTCVWMLSKLDTDKAWSAVFQLSVLMGGLLIMIRVLSKSESVSKQAVKTVFLMVLLIGVLEAVTGALQYFNLAPSLETAAALSLLLVTMTGVYAALGHIGPVAEIAFKGAVGMLKVLGVLSLALLAVGGATKIINQIAGDDLVGSVMDNGVAFMTKIGEAIGGFIGGIIGGFKEGAANSLPEIGTKLSEFADNASGYFDIVNSVDTDVYDVTTKIAQAINELAYVDDLSNVSFDGLGEKLNTFGTAIADFSEKISGKIDVESVSAAAAAGQCIADLYKYLPKEKGWVQSFLGETTDLSAFSTQLTDFGEAIVDFSATVAGAVKRDAVEAATNAGKIVAELYDALPKEDGWVQGIFGQSMSLETFATDLNEFGTAIVTFSATVAGGVKEDVVEAAANAGEMIANLYELLPTKTPNWLSNMFGGSMDLTAFGTDLGAFGEAVSKFSTDVSGVTPASVQGAIDVAKLVSALYENLPKEEGLATRFGNWIAGGNPMAMDKFVGALSIFGNAVSDFYEILSQIPEQSLSNAVTQSAILVGIVKQMGEINSDSVGNFADAVVNLLSRGIKDFAKAFNTMEGFISENAYSIIEAFATSVFAGEGKITEAFGSIVDAASSSIMDRAHVFYLLGKSWISSLSLGVQNGSNNIGETISSMISSAMSLIINADEAFFYNGYSLMSSFNAGIKDGSALVESSISSAIASSYGSIDIGSDIVYQAGCALMTSLSDGISSKSNSIFDIFSGIVTNVISTIKNRSIAFIMAGKGMMMDLGSGILNNISYVVTDRGSAPAGAINSMMDKIVSIISSYSFNSLGKAVAIGFASGIIEETPVPEAASKAMAEIALKAAKYALDINSPSKKFRQLGCYVSEGLADGINKMGGAVTIASRSLAQSAVDSAESAISKIGSISAQGMDITPMITPVIDANPLNAETLKLGADIDARVAGPISSLSQMIASAQNEIYNSNNEVIAAINALRSDINALYEGDDQEIALYVDSKKLATSLAKPMNRQLNILSKRGAY